MKLYLASPHTILRFRGWCVIADAIFRRGITNDNLHGGGVSGNLKPAWKAMKENTPEAFVEALKNENFWQGGESRHWIQYATSPIKENEDISSREHIVPEVYRSDAIRGGALA